MEEEIVCNRWKDLAGKNVGKRLVSQVFQNLSGGNLFLSLVSYRQLGKVLPRCTLLLRYSFSIVPNYWKWNDEKRMPEKEKLAVDR